MAIYTIVHTSADNGMVACYGQINSRDAAERIMKEMDESIERDIAGGGDELAVCKLRYLSDWVQD